MTAYLSEFSSSSSFLRLFAAISSRIYLFETDNQFLVSSSNRWKRGSGIFSSFFRRLPMLAVRSCSFQHFRNVPVIAVLKPSQSLVFDVLEIP